MREANGGGKAVLAVVASAFAGLPRSSLWFDSKIRCSSAHAQRPTQNSEREFTIHTSGIDGGYSADGSP